ncbi:MAG: hypothetical protein MK081_11490 [Flavobacteriales bacterium]|nr:hypothetical protein [Flavobacteriales bacterium]
MRTVFILLSVVAILSFASAEHKFYHSYTSMRHNPNTNAFEIEMRIFTDDLEKAIGGDEDPIRLGSDKEIEDADYRIEKYIRDRFHVKSNDQELYWKYWGMEVDYDITWIYLEISNVQPINVLSIENRILFEHFEDQNNEITLEYNGWTKRMHLTTAEPKSVIQN